ncbi:MAG: BatA domain-containing protein [Phycisphaerales bacterium]
MTFLQPMLFAAGAACVAIPILIHLLARRRRKPIVWGAMRFLLEAYRRQKRRLRIEQLLLLLVRCAVVALIAVAIGRPALEAAGVLGGGGGKTVYLVVDTSLASSAKGEDGRSALQRHARSAERLIEGLSAGDRVGVIALGAPARGVVLPAAADVSAVKGVISRLEATDARADWAGGMELLRGELAREEREGGGRAMVVVLSDFTAGSADVGEALTGALRGMKDPSRVTVVAQGPRGVAGGNVSVVGVDALRPVVVTGGAPGAAGGGASEQVRVRLARSGDVVGSAGTTVVRVGAASAETGRVEGTWARGEVRWSAGQSEASVSVGVDAAGAARRGGSGWALVAEIDEDAIAGDNVFRRPVGVRESLKVGVVDRRTFASGARVLTMSGGEWLGLALRPGKSGGATVEPVEIAPTAIDASVLAGVDVVFVCRPDLIEAEGWERLSRHVEGGGVVVVFPPSEGAVHTWTDAFARAFGLDWRIAREARTWETAARLAVEQPEHALTALLRPEMAELTRAVGVTRALPIESGSGVSEVLRLEDGTGWIVSARGSERLGSGMVVYGASALHVGWTDLPVKPLFVALAQEVVRQGVGESVSGWAQVAGSRVTAPRRTEELRAAGETEGAGLLVDSGGQSVEPARKGALYRAVDGRGAERGVVAVNADVRGARVDGQSEAVVSAWLNAGFEGADGGVRWVDEESVGQAGRAREEKAMAGWPLLLGALFLALIETALARWFSHALREEGGSAT